MKICFATHNENKLKEVRQILGADYQVVGLTDIGCTEEIPETGATLSENSQIKAEYVFKTYGIDCFADDTGLEVEALEGAPGVYSARYAGAHKNNADNIALLLSNLEGHTHRTARFRTVITLIRSGIARQVEGAVEGEINEQLVGKEGFGYDSVFTPKGTNSTFAEMTPEEKNAISHRGRAMKAFVELLSTLA